MAQKPRIAIVGAGLMGHGLALVFADAGHSVAVADASTEVRRSVRSQIGATLQSLGKSEAALKLISIADSLGEAAAEADIVIEAAPENLELKQRLFAELEAAAPAHALLASNTSVIPIGQIAARVSSKHRVLGTHWWNPPYLVPLVEVIETAGTAPATIATMMSLLKALGKVPVHVKKDVPGFVGNRLQHALWREAIALVADGVCDAETVDLVVKNSFGRRLAVLGPPENADLVGTDLTQAIHRLVLPDLDCSSQPNAYLNALVREGKLGFKSNQGFKTWTEDKKTRLRAAVREHLIRIDAMLGTQGGNDANG